MSNEDLKPTSPEEMLAAARGETRRKAPYLTAAVYALIPYPVDGLSTMGVTKGLVLFYDPAWIMTMTYQECAFVLCHEVMHVLRDHASRQGIRDQKLFNQAGDLGINQDLVAAGWTMPEGDNVGLLPSAFGFKDGLSAEEYYELLSQQKASGQGQGKKGKGGKGKGQGQGSSGGTGQGQGKENGGGQGTGDRPGQGHCGGCAGNPGDKELEDKLDAEIGRTAAAKKSLERKVAQDIRDHVANKGRGTVPQSLVQWANAPRKKSKIPWQRKLTSILRKTSGRIQAGGMDYSMSRPAKRSYTRGIIRPGLVQQEPEVAFVLDTSGSMGGGQIRTGLQEAYAVMRALGIDQVWWLEADAGVANIPERIGIKKLTSMKIHGGGGTDFTPGIEACAKLRPKPDILVYFTDGDGGAPAHPPVGMEVVWCIVPSYYNKRPASWGTAIIMRETGDTKEYPNLVADEEEEDAEDDA